MRRQSRAERRRLAAGAAKCRRSAVWHGVVLGTARMTQPTCGGRLRVSLAQQQPPRVDVVTPTLFLGGGPSQLSAQNMGRPWRRSS